MYRIKQNWKIKEINSVSNLTQQAFNNGMTIASIFWVVIFVVILNAVRLI